MRLAGLSVALSVGMLLTPATAFGQSSPGTNQLTVIYFVRHAEVDVTDPAIPLSAEGKRRADIFALSLGAVNLTHVFSSHTTRARQMVEPAARHRGLPVRQLPLPGTRFDGVTVTDTTPSNLAISPLVQALRELPPGSNALVGVNSDNIYAILHRLGVPVASQDHLCAKGAMCVPCLTKACVSPRFDQLWMLMIERGSGSPKLIELRY